MSVCIKCGTEMPALSAELKSLAAASGGVALAHEVCPTDVPAKPEGRYFEVRTTIVEVLDDHPELEPVEFMRFKEGVRAENLDAAMRPLAVVLGEKWALAEKRANVADSTAADPS